MSQTSPPSPPQRPRILIVDDEPDVVATLEYLLRRRYRVLTASSANEARDVLQREDIQVILCDQRMPGITGDRLLVEARALRPEAVRILLTGYADIQAVQRAINDAGIFRYVPKPWDSAELEEIVAQAVEHHSLIRERRILLEQLHAANEKLRAANAELAEADALKTAFLEVASHELNTPITIILGLADLLLLENPHRPDADRQSIEQIAASARQLSRLVGTMLKLSHANDFRNPLRCEPTDLAGLCESVADQLQPIVDHRRLRLERFIDHELGEFWIDPDKIRDVVANLLSNAIKFTPDGEQIRLELGRDLDTDGARLIVADHGIGLDPRSLENLFQPFFTEFDASTHSSGDFGFRKRGLGLGLSLVRRFVELHAGSVEAASSPGQGTTITVHLPRGPRPLERSLVESSQRG
ncbi:MAG: hypothetical protein KatS3mg108_2889 [Isosphaeraceae bacterium]|jgi:signal transduction histidine kinase|nr:MAG: hypothetical protein KatS3mg108_2889 [Isosphaeraceae bacterium]